MGNCYMQTPVKSSIVVDIKEPSNHNSNHRMKSKNSLKQSIKEEEIEKVAQEESPKNGDIIIKSRETNYPQSRIEVRLPNPYSELESDKQKKIISYTINSKFKSRYADYINRNSTMDSTKVKNGLKIIKTYKDIVPAKFDKYIHFTNIHYNKSKRDFIKTNINRNFGMGFKENDIIMEGNDENNE